jgi:hypothetical protein
MIVIRPTAKLGKKIHENVRQSIGLQEDPLLDWHATLLTSGRTQYILFMNSWSFYTGISFGAGITDNSKFIKTFFSVVRDQMTDDGLLDAYGNRIAENAGAILCAKAAHRSATGVLTECALTAKLALDERAPNQVASLLNQMVWAPLDGLTPLECMRTACGVTPSDMR